MDRDIAALAARTEPRMLIPPLPSLALGNAGNETANKNEVIIIFLQRNVRQDSALLES
jgi:hypothetical protein